MDECLCIYEYGILECKENMYDMQISRQYFYEYRENLFSRWYNFVFKLHIFNCVYLAVYGPA